MRSLEFDRDKLAALCRSYNVRRLAVFGSVLAGTDSAGSDLDLLVEFEPGNTPGWGMFELQDQLSYLFGQTVDLNTPGFLSRYFRDSIVKSARTLYAC